MTFNTTIRNVTIHEVTFTLPHPTLDHTKGCGAFILSINSKETNAALQAFKEEFAAIPSADFVAMNAKGMDLIVQFNNPTAADLFTHRLQARMGGAA